ncbi:hypothetical protein B0T22DRAFT_441705 [Podospora appendiculata]|uniref:Uncharacterized protein n=1 Tax=Podospora appendiculata TaxID=314037 RepID=A0AAE0XD56_9PEZI|nr:hypothetical protein B0T22DRAFT_441705 [Podospora appendiculata]
MPPQEPDFDEDLESKGQLFFSKELAKILGDKYNPDAHWTSTLRAKHRLGFPEYRGDAICSFTFNDAECNGAWTKAVAAAEYHDALRWRSRPPTWHIEVKTVGSLGGFSSSSLLLTLLPVYHLRIRCTYLCIKSTLVSL